MKIVNRINRKTTTELLVDETIFSCSNGFIGVRGNFVEGYGFDQAKQTYMNSFINTYDYKYEENSIHFPQTGERIVNIIDGQTIEFTIGQEHINMEDCELLNLNRSFDLEKGFTLRKATFKTPSGKELLLSEEKLVSFYQKELLAIRIELTPLNFEGDVEIRSALELPKQRIENKMDPRINISKHPEVLIERKMLKPAYAALFAKTSKTDLSLYVSMAHTMKLEYEETSSGVEGIKKVHITPKTPLKLTKFVLFTSSIIHSELIKSNQTMLNRVITNGFDFYLEQQIHHLEKFWIASLIEIEGNDEINQMLQYNIYQLNSSHLGLSDFNICSKGLSGEGYEGHYFWDTEIYMFPFFLYTNPKKAKALIENRFKHLKEAKIEAYKLGVTHGAKIPWRTIRGNELSPYYPAGSAQFHINSDVAYTIIKYMEMTQDVEFLKETGFELLVETGRFLLYAGNFENDKFHINTVTGPDEYSAIVNDNYYTNAMAKYHFDKIVEYSHQYSKMLISVKKKINLVSQEIDIFSKASREMVLLFDEKRQIFAQDAQFLQKPILDLKSIPEENFPLLLHYHPLFIYRHQVLKQADTLLALYLLNYKDFPILRNNFDYYLPLTTHDSSLSKCIYSIIAAKLGDSNLAVKYLLDVLRIDFENTHHNTHHGLHVANLGGSYLAITNGLLGLEIDKDSLSIHPVLPNEFKRITIHLGYKDTNLCFKISPSTIEISTDKPIQIGIYNDLVFIENEYRCDI